MHTHTHTHSHAHTHTHKTKVSKIYIYIYIYAPLYIYIHSDFYFIKYANISLNGKSMKHLIRSSVCTKCFVERFNANNHKLIEMAKYLIFKWLSKDLE